MPHIAEVNLTINWESKLPVIVRRTFEGGDYSERRFRNLAEAYRWLELLPDINEDEYDERD